MKNFFMKYYQKFFKKEPDSRFDFTGFEVKLYNKGVLLACSVGGPDDITAFVFPLGSFMQTESGNILTGYRIVPHLERI